jgi:tRNA (guanine37-N1)-methyltransferase
MHISILTLFPDMLRSPFSESIVKRAIDKKLITIDYVNIRDFATDNYKTVDGHPYGGGVGMILRVDVVDRALQSVKKGHKILLDAGGVPYKQSKATELSKLNHLIMICGHYEGIDERIRSLVDEEISIGDYILTGGEIPAMVLTDSIVRLIPGVLSKPEAFLHESFSGAMLEYPQYTEPHIYKGLAVPSVLLSGNHTAIDAWQKNEATKRTASRRPDLIS